MIPGPTKAVSFTPQIYLEASKHERSIHVDTIWLDYKCDDNVALLWPLGIERPAQSIIISLNCSLFCKDNSFCSENLDRSKNQMCFLSFVGVYTAHEFSWISLPVVYKNWLLPPHDSQGSHPRLVSVMSHK